jgi:prepilin-type N-terminal cleavage/methylation domain-containing protein
MKAPAFCRAFTMIELLASIAILAVIAAIVFAFVGNYVDYARLTAARRTCAILNESLNEYRTLGGLTKAHSLQGAVGTTQNARTLTDDAITALKTGFTVGGIRKNFVNKTQSIDTSMIGSTGQGSHFRFVIDAGQPTTPVAPQTPK